jgi:hypothetical protein
VPEDNVEIIPHVQSDHQQDATDRVINEIGDEEPPFWD